MTPDEIMKKAEPYISEPEIGTTVRLLFRLVHDLAVNQQEIAKEMAKRYVEGAELPEGKLPEFQATIPEKDHWPEGEP